MRTRRWCSSNGPAVAPDTLSQRLARHAEPLLVATWSRALGRGISSRISRPPTEPLVRHRPRIDETAAGRGEGIGLLETELGCSLEVEDATRSTLW
jgi:hypothetical protein